MAAKIRKGDTVVVMRGKKQNKGQTGKVLKVIPSSRNTSRRYPTCARGE